MLCWQCTALYSAVVAGAYEMRRLRGPGSTCSHSVAPLECCKLSANTPSWVGNKLHDDSVGPLVANPQPEQLAVNNCPHHRQGLPKSEPLAVTAIHMRCLAHTKGSTTSLNTVGVNRCGASNTWDSRHSSTHKRPSWLSSSNRYCDAGRETGTVMQAGARR